MSEFIPSHESETYTNQEVRDAELFLAKGIVSEIAEVNALVAGLLDDSLGNLYRVVDDYPNDEKNKQRFQRVIAYIDYLGEDTQKVHELQKLYDQYFDKPPLDNATYKNMALVQHIAKKMLKQQKN